MMRNIIVYLILLSAFTSIAQTRYPKIPDPPQLYKYSTPTKVVLIDFDCKINYITLIPKDTLRVIDEVIAESNEYGVTKSISIINIIMPHSYYDKCTNKIAGKARPKLATIYIFPSAAKEKVTWYPIQAQDSIIRKSINCEQFAIDNYGANPCFYSHYEVIIKREGQYFENDGYAIGETQQFCHNGTYYPNQNEGLNCESRVFSRQEIEAEQRKIDTFRTKNNFWSVNPFDISSTYFANSKDALTKVVHFERYADLQVKAIYYKSFCGEKTLKGARGEWLYFTELDAHEFLGILGGNLFCFGSDGMLPEADRLSRRYYKFKSIGGFTDIRQYYQYYLELGAGRIPRSKKS